jgi:hypothetical protein
MIPTYNTKIFYRVNRYNCPLGVCLLSDTLQHSNEIVMFVSHFRCALFSYPMLSVFLWITTLSRVQPNNDENHNTEWPREYLSINGVRSKYQSRLRQQNYSIHFDYSTIILVITFPRITLNVMIWIFYYPHLFFSWSNKIYKLQCSLYMTKYQKI